MASAASLGTSPTEAQARVSAASKSSSAWSQARSLVWVAPSPTGPMPANSPSDGEEDSLVRPLEPDVEPVRPVAGQDVNQRRAPLRRDMRGDAVAARGLL